MSLGTPSRHRRGLLLAGLLALAVLLAGCGAEGAGGELRPLDARLDDDASVRALFSGDRLVYAFVADPAYRVMMMKAAPKTLPAGLVWCFGVEDGLYLEGQPVTRPAGAAVFALRGDGSTAAIELAPGELKELTRSLLTVRGPLEDEALATKLRAALRP